MGILAVGSAALAAEVFFKMLRCLTSILLMVAIASGCATIRPGDVSDLVREDSAKKKPLESQLAMARLCERRGENDQARAMYEKVLRESPQQPEALHRLAVVCVRENQRADAHKYFDEAARITNSAELNNDRGYLLLLEGNYAAAEKDFRQATELKPSLTAAWTNLGLAIGYQDRYDEAFAIFLRATNSAAEAHCNLGFVFAQQSKLAEAQKHYRLALVENPNLKIAAEALLQVSANMPGQEPRTILRTMASTQPAKSDNVSHGTHPEMQAVPETPMPAPVQPTAAPGAN